MSRRKFDKVDRELGNIKRQYHRAIKKGSVALEKGKLLEKVVRLILKEKGYVVSKIGGATHGIPDVSISAKKVVLSHSTLYYEGRVFECCNLGKKHSYRDWYIRSLTQRFDKYWGEGKIVFLIYSYSQIFRGYINYLEQLKNIRDYLLREDFELIELGFQVHIKNLNRKLYENVKRKLDNYF